MPYNYIVYKQHHLVVSTGTGRVTCSEIKARQDQTRNDPEFDPNFNQIVDLRTVTTVDLTVDEARMLASRTVFSSSARRAFVVTSPAVFGMGRMWEAFTEIAQGKSQIRLFSNLASALDWLGLKSDLNII